MWVIISLFFAPLGGLLAGSLKSNLWRAVWMTAALFGPLIFYTVDLASYPPSPPGFWLWWLTGLVYLGVPLLVSALVSVLSFLAGRKMSGRLSVKDGS